MAEALKNSIAVVGIDIGKNSFHVVGLDKSGAIVLRQKWSRGQVEARFTNMPPCLIGMEACVGAHHLPAKMLGQLRLPVSALVPDSDSQTKVLIYLRVAGSMLDAYSQFHEGSIYQARVDMPAARLVVLPKIGAQRAATREMPYLGVGLVLNLKGREA